MQRLKIVQRCDSLKVTLWVCLSHHTYCFLENQGRCLISVIVIKALFLKTTESVIIYIYLHINYESNWTNLCAKACLMWYPEMYLYKFNFVLAHLKFFILCMRIEYIMFLILKSEILWVDSESKTFSAWVYTLSHDKSHGMAGTHL